MFIHCTGLKGSHWDGQDVECCRWETRTASCTTRNWEPEDQHLVPLTEPQQQPGKQALPAHSTAKKTFKTNHKGDSRSHMKHTHSRTAARAVTAALQCLVRADLYIKDSQRHRNTSHTWLACIMHAQKLTRTDTLALNSHPFTWLGQA